MRCWAPVPPSVFRRLSRKHCSNTFKRIYENDGLKYQTLNGSQIFLGFQRKIPQPGKFTKRSKWLRSEIRRSLFDGWLTTGMLIVCQSSEKFLWYWSKSFSTAWLNASILRFSILHKVIIIKSILYDIRTQKETYECCVALMGFSGMSGVWSRLIRTLFDKLGRFLSCITRHVHLLPYNRGPLQPRLRRMRSVAQGEAYAFSPNVYLVVKKPHSSAYGFRRSLRVDPKKTDTIAMFQAPTCRKELLISSATSWILPSIFLQFCTDITSSSRSHQARSSMKLGAWSGKRV